MTRLFFWCLLLLGCSEEGGDAQGCKKDSDCPRPEMKCVVHAGTCVGFSAGLNPKDIQDGGAASSDAR
ncbi:MAG: hypothetical protein HY698_14350 [Deltaproteobacteria bacterium]|nr:hypothetical protein [Deltaproteobacteria bacterium]